MENLPRSRDGERGSQSQSPTHHFFRARVLTPFSIIYYRLWEWIRRLAAFAVTWLVMFGLPLIYQRRLARLDQSPREQLALEQLPAQEAERGGRASTQEEPDPLRTQTGQVLIQRCVLEWQVCVKVNTITLTLISALFAILPSTSICRALFYIAFFVALSALVIGVIFLVHFQHAHGPEEGGLWLSHVNRTEGIRVNYFLAYPVLWSSWALLLLIMSFLSHLWTSPGGPLSLEQGTESSEPAGHTLDLWTRFLPTAVLPIALWNIWVIWTVLPQPFSEMS